jgi:hypothetical protein
MQNKVTLLNTLYQFDFMSLVNKNEMIGFRSDNYNMAVLQYKNSVKSTSDRITTLINQANMVQQSLEFSNSDKQVQLGRLYGDADLALGELDVKTTTFVTSLRNLMPSLTYQKFVKKFQEYYYSLGISR